MIILCFADRVHVICQPLAGLVPLMPLRCVKATCCGKMTVLVIAPLATFSVSVSNMNGGRSWVVAFDWGAFLTGCRTKLETSM